MMVLDYLNFEDIVMLMPATAVAQDGQPAVVLRATPQGATPDPTLAEVVAMLRIAAA